MEDLVAAISRLYVTQVRNRSFIHQHHPDASPSRFSLDLTINSGSRDGVVITFRPGMKTDVTGGRYQEVPDIFGETYGQYANKVEYRIEGNGDLLQVTGPLLKREKYPVVFPVVEEMHALLTAGRGLGVTEQEDSLLYARIQGPIN